MSFIKEVSSDDAMARELQVVYTQLMVPHPERIETGTVHITGLSFKARGYEVFCVIRGLCEDEGDVVSFVTAETWRSAIVKVSRLIRQKQAVWRKDKYAGENGQ